MNYIRTYHKQITQCKILAPKHIIATYDRVVKGIDEGKWKYDSKKGQKPIEFIELFCKQSQGDLGADFKLMLWQKALIETVFGCINPKTNLRQFKEVFVLVARKNGKSTLLAGISLYMLIADKEGAAQIYSVATKLDQAKIILNEAYNMVKQSPSLKRVLRKRRNDIYFEHTSSTMSALASTSKSMDGLNAHLGIVDECHALRDRVLYEQLKQATKSRRQPLIFVITTAGTVRENIYDELYDYAVKVAIGEIEDNTFLPFLYELDSEEEWKDEKCWIKANPGLGEIIQVDSLKEEVDRAKKDPSYLKGVLVKHFNIRQSEVNTWLSFNDINNTETYEDLKDCYAIGGADLSSTTDLTCATLLIEKQGKIKVKQMYWMPKEALAFKTNDDKVPYDTWVDRGLLRLCEGHTVKYSDVTAWFVENVKLGIRPLWIGYDSWNANYWKEEMENYGFDMIEVRQGAKTFSGPMKQMGADLTEKKVNYNNNPILKWCLTNTAIKSDENDNIRPVKNKQRSRIDGAVSLLDAYVIYQDKLNEYRKIMGE